MATERERAEPPANVIAEAIEEAKLSPCQSKRGAAVFRGDTVDGTGHNHLVEPFTCDGSDACKRTCRAHAVHAEQAAMIEARGYCYGSELLHVKVVDGELVPSGGPTCSQCSKIAVEAGIAGVWLYHADGWRRYEATEFHRLSVLSAPAPVAPPDALRALVEKWRKRATLWSGDYDEDFRNIDAVNECADELSATLSAPSAGWQDIGTHDKSEKPVLVGLIDDRGIVRRATLAAYLDGVGYYELGSGDACHWRTHWCPAPPAGPATGGE